MMMPYRPPVDFHQRHDPAYRLQYQLMLDQDGERLDGWWGRFRRWRLARREYLSYADAAYLFSVDAGDVAAFVELGYMHPVEDMTGRPYATGELVVRRVDLSELLFAPLPPCPADHPLYPKVPIPPTQLVLRF